MGKNLKYGEFTFAAPKARPTAAGYQSTKGISKDTYDKGHAQALKSGGKACSGYAKGGPKMPAKPMKREPEAMVRKEVALLKKAGAPKAIIEHEVRESKSPIAMKKGGKACYADGGMSKMDKKMGKVMREYGDRELHSGSKEGPVVRNPKQALAIAYSEGRKAKKMNEGGQYAAGTTEKMRKEGDVLNELSKKYGTATQKYAKGGNVEKKLEKHANMPASKAHGPGAAARLKKVVFQCIQECPKSHE
jgi:hypothetical protein